MRRDSHPPGDHDGLRGRALCILDEARRRPLQTLEHVLPSLLNLNGQPYTLDAHFVFAPLFRTRKPRTRVLCTARQVSKSTYLAADGILFSAMHAHSMTLFVTPLFEQIRRFSSNYIAPFVDESPIKPLLVDTTCNQSVLQRSYRNRAKQIFSYAYLSASRIRGIGGVWRCCLDERQDMDDRHVPIIAETMSYAPKPWGIMDITGTPKGYDNPLYGDWTRSSMAEWFTRCDAGGCGHWNIASAEHDLVAMIGPLRDDISERYPGVVCAKCRRPINPRSGNWVHRMPGLRWERQGFHVPQAIMPAHFGDKIKWAILLNKQATLPPHTFFNEVLGESYDTGSKLLTLTELQAAATLPWKNSNDPGPEVRSRLHQYKLLTLGVDWGGGGTERISFTTIALCGLRTDGTIDCLWGRRLLTPNDHAREAADVFKIITDLKPNFVAHDFNGAGAIRETMLVQAGVRLNCLVPIHYSAVKAGKIMSYNSPADDPNSKRGYHSVDRTRVLLTTVNAIKFAHLRFFADDFQDKESPGLLRDFTALTEEKIETRTSDSYVIRRMPGQSDDFAHAVTYACCALWHSAGAWPNFIANARSSPDQIGGDWAQG